MAFGKGSGSNGTDLGKVGGLEEGAPVEVFFGDVLEISLDAESPVGIDEAQVCLDAEVGGSEVGPFEMGDLESYFEKPSTF